LVDRFLTRLAERLGREKKGIEGDALAALARYAWPGNVRELRNVIERAAVLAGGPSIRASDLPPLAANEKSAVSAPAAVAAGTGESFADAKRRSVEDFERTYIQSALRESGGNISKAAQAMGMARQSLQQKIRELGLRGASEDDADG
jgi:two-component system, NtrC family, response regulator AtoC